MVRGALGTTPVAVKVLSHADSHSATELVAFAQLGAGHVNVVRTYAAVSAPDGTATYLPMQLCDTDLLSYTIAVGGLRECDSAVVFKQVVAGVCYLHSRGVYHMDLKADNIMMVKGVPKIVDLGAAVLAAPGTSGACMTTKSCGTLIYACPESMSKPHDEFDAEKADVWALGISIYASVTGFFPWGRAQACDASYVRWAAHRSKGGPTLSLSVLCCATSKSGYRLSAPFCDLVSRALHPDPRQRASMQELRQHPFFPE